MRVALLISVVFVAGCTSDDRADERFAARGLECDRLPVTYEDGELAECECFGRSYVSLMRLSGRRLQAHIGLGAEAPTDVREDALELVNVDGTCERITSVVRS